MDSATLVGSLASGTTYLNNPVEELLGHPAAKVIDQACVTETLQSGCRLLTHDTTGAESKKKPFRWMWLRRVPWTEAWLMEADEAHLARIQNRQRPPAVWHFVVTELHQRGRGEPIVCASDFLSNFELLMSVIREKFELLDEDDPGIIHAALLDEDFQSVLRLYFQTGSETNPKFMHTMAGLSPFSGQTLLNYCCERDYVECVRVLLAGYTPQTAPAGQPWLRLADPMWQDRQWKNSAFSIAAYRGYPELMAALWAWAGEHGLKRQVIRQTDKRGNTLTKIITDRMRKAPPAERAALVRTFNIIAADVGEVLMDATLSDVNRLPVENALVVVDKENGDREPFPQQSDAVSLAALASIVEELPCELSGSSVLFLHVRLAAGHDDAQQAADARRLLRLLEACRSVRFMKCSSPLKVTACMVDAASEALRSGRARWASLGIVPQPMDCPDQSGAAKHIFAAAVQDFVAAVRESCGTNGLATFDLPPGAPQLFPPMQAHVPHVLSHVFTMKRVAFILANEGQEQVDLRKKLRDNATGHNPLLAIFAALERRLLDKGSLSLNIKDTVAEAMRGEWVEYATAMALSLATHAIITASEWMPRLGLDPAGEDASMLLRMADDALLHLLKMRPSARRGGLDVVPGVRMSLAVLADGATAFSATRRYMSERGL